MLRAIIFDFDGIIANTEPTHLEAFKKVLLVSDIKLSDEDYYEKYLAFDDKTLFREIFKDNGISPENGLISNLVFEKNNLMKQLFETHVELFPGIIDLLEILGERYKLAIGSGALKSEIELVLNKYGINDHFINITAADDVINCKPDPEVYLKVLDKINSFTENEILPEECIVFEDSKYGIKAAKSAGMKCIAITNTYEKNLLEEADLVVDSFNSIDISILENL